MAPSGVRTYKGPDEVKAAYQSTEVEFTPTGPDEFLTRITRAELGSVRLNRAVESGARIKWAAQAPNRVFFRFLTQPGPRVIFSGVPIPFGSLVRHRS